MRCSFFVFDKSYFFCIFLPIMSNETGDEKSEQTEVTSEVQSLWKNIYNLTSYPAPRQIYNINFLIRTGRRLS